MASVEQQIRWLGTLLAARGMPRLLLEEHLRVLHQELVAAVPERAGEYAVLVQAANTLRREREASMPESRLSALEAGFRELLGSAAEDDMRAGRLIAAAVADERAAVPRAVESLVDWLADPTRFPPHWRTAVDQVLRRARRTRAGGTTHSSSSPAVHAERSRGGPPDLTPPL
jgi:hypothetical protein